jgi:Zn-dependent protease
LPAETVALGFVVCIYIHEMGHVAQLARYGIAASPPMFIPGLGAFVRLKQSPADVRQDARVGLAGPIWGLAAALVAYAIGLAMGAAIWAAIARTAAFLNLFNLLPIWQLDGGRGFRSLARLDRWIAVAALLVAWALTSQGFLLLLAGGAVFRAVRKDAPADHDWPALATYIALIAVLAPLSMVPVVTAAR